LILAFGRYGGLYPLIAQLPGIQGLRAPSRHLVLFQLALSVIAAVAIEDLFALARGSAPMPSKRLWPLAIPAALALVITGIAVSLSGSTWAVEHGYRFSGLLRATPWSIVVILMAALFALAGRRHRWAPIVIVIFAAVDQAAWGNLYNFNWGPLKSIAQLRAEAKVPADAREGDLIQVVPGNLDHLAILRGLRLTGGYTGLYPRMTLDESDPRTQTLEGVNWIGDGDRWTRVADAFPRARLEALESSGSIGTIRMVAMRPGHFEIETTASGPQRLIFTERFHSGWRATIDGVEYSTTRVYDDFLGVVVESGQHSVTLDFAPESLWVGLMITAIGIVVSTVFVGQLLYASPRSAAASASTDSNR
jgi:hypothetical protein